MVTAPTYGAAGNIPAVLHYCDHYVTGALIERMGLKGHSIGGAQVSELHANFIINNGEATGADVRNLMRDVEQRVLKATGIHLEREVRLLGD